MIEPREPDPHDAFRELCALSTAGPLADRERMRLEAHLETCSACRELRAQYAIVVHEGMPWLAGNAARQDHDVEWDETAARHRLRAALDVRSGPAPLAGIAAPRTGVRARARWLATAAAASVLIAVGAAAYWLGTRHEADTQSANAALAGQLQEASAESLTRAREIEQLRLTLAALTRQSHELAASAADKEQRVAVLTQERGALAVQLEAREQSLRDAEAAAARLRGIVEERAALAERLRHAEDRYQHVQTELAALGAQAGRERELQTQNRQLSARLEEQRQELRRSEQLLVSDSDIRELMGARQLYIADVFDVSSDSRTRKPYGRVFYTRGKSLIVYAFDLDRQQGIRNVSTFQVWGRNESAQDRPVNLGILYLDSEANRRWALRFDDAKQLKGLDAVFVTIEPNGQGNTPTGKPFLYASLRKEPNHP